MLHPVPRKTKQQTCRTPGSKRNALPRPLNTREPMNLTPSYTEVMLSRPVSSENLRGLSRYKRT